MRIKSAQSFQDSVEIVEIIPYQERTDLARQARYACAAFYGRTLPCLLVEDAGQESSSFYPSFDSETGELIPAVQVSHPSVISLRLKEEERTPLKIRYNYRRTLIHETAHLHHLLFLNLITPKWFDEGLAEYVSNEAFEYDGIRTAEERRQARLKHARDLFAEEGFKGLESFHDYSGWVKSNEDRRYHLAYMFVYDMLAEQDGKSKLFQLINDSSVSDGIDTLLEFAEKLSLSSTEGYTPEDISLKYQDYLRGNDIDRTSAGFMDILKKHFGDEFFSLHKAFIKKD